MPEPTTIHLIRDDRLSSHRLLAIRAVRDALRFLNGTATLAEAEPIIGQAHARGFALIGVSSDPQTLRDVASVLRESGFSCRMGESEEILEREVEVGRRLSPEEAFAAVATAPHAQAAYEPQESDAQGFSVDAYRTMAVLLVHNEGHPLRAAVEARNLARAQDDPESWGEVVLLILDLFPWLREALTQQGIVV